MTADECIDRITEVLSRGATTIAPGGTDLVDHVGGTWVEKGSFNPYSEIELDGIPDMTSK